MAHRGHQHKARTTNTPFFDKARTKLGVKPVAPPPVYEPDVVVEAILHAAKNGPRDIVVGAASRAMTLGQTISPRLLDAILGRRIGFKAHYTDEPKPEGAPDNLFESLGGTTIEGSFSGRAHPRSFYTWLQTHPTAMRSAVVGATVLGAAATLRKRAA